MNEEIYKAARLSRGLKALRAKGRTTVRGAAQPVRRELSPPSALGTASPTTPQPEWMRSYGTPGPRTGW